MIEEIEFASTAPAVGFSAMQAAWADPAIKVVVMRAADRIEDTRAFFDTNFGLIGTPAPLAEDVNAGDREQQRTGEIWMEVRYDPRHPDAYRHSANAQPLHTDGSYIPDFPNASMLACVANAGEGGETTFIDGADIYHALESERPDLLEALTRRTIPHARSGDRRDEMAIERRQDGIWVNWNYYCVDKSIDPGGRELADDLFGFLQSSPLVRENIVPVKLRPGDAVTWKDRRVMHGRNGFVATHESERFIWKCAIDVGNFAG
jgi:alpha-ketoglutarate-dependent taurine dioxygenase